MKKKIKVEVHHGILKAAIAIFIFVALILIFAFITDEAVLEKENGFDKIISDFLSPYSTRTMIRFMSDISFFGSSAFMFPASVILTGYFLVRKKIKYAIDVAVVSITGTALEFGLKLLFHRNRPDLPLIDKLTTYSFPSGHAFSSVIFYGLLIYLIWEGANISNTVKWMLSVLLALFSLTIGVSRIVLRVHYATDIIAGISLAIAWMILCLWALKYIYPRFSRNS